MIWPRSLSFMTTRKSPYLSQWKKIRKTEHKWANHSINHWKQMSCAWDLCLFLLLHVCLLHLILSSFLFPTLWNDPKPWLDRWWKWLNIHSFFFFFLTVCVEVNLELKLIVSFIITSVIEDEVKDCKPRRILQIQAHLTGNLLICKLQINKHQSAWIHQTWIHYFLLYSFFSIFTWLYDSLMTVSV